MEMKTVTDAEIKFAVGLSARAALQKSNGAIPKLINTSQTITGPLRNPYVHPAVPRGRSQLSLNIIYDAKDPRFRKHKRSLSGNWKVLVNEVSALP